MKREKIIQKIKELSQNFLDKKISGSVYAKNVEEIIALNLEEVSELEDFADFLAQYHDPKDDLSLYGNSELIRKIN